MKRLLLLAALAAVAALTSGCAAAYTSIHKNDDGTYLITRTKSGFIRTYGSHYLCTVNGEAMTCREIDSL